MVSEWMVNGSIRNFVSVYRNANRLELVRFRARVALLTAQNDLVLAVNGRRCWVSLHARQGHHPR